MAGNEHLSRTMRIDLIPDVPASPDAEKHARVRFSKRAGSPVLRLPKVEGRREESHFQRLLQQLYDAALISDLSGRIIDVNVRAEEFFRCEKAELRDMMVADVISGADEQVIKTVSDNLENERHTLIQAYCTRQDGTYFPAEIAVSKLDLGTVLLCFFVRDITIRRQAEEMLITEHNALQNSGSGIAVVDLAGRVEYANPAMERMWQCPTREGLLGLFLQDLMADHDAATGMIRELLEGETMSSVADMRARRLDGSDFSVQVSGTRNRNAEGETVGCVFSLVDTGDRKRAEEAERELERRRVMLESLGAACHHLGQPATMLLGNLELLRERLTGQQDAETRKLVEGSLDAMERLTEVLRRLTSVNEYRTTEYLQAGEGSGGAGDRILEI